MASPIGHTLMGSTIGLSLKADRKLFLFAVFAASVPDIDFLLGFLFGDIKILHHEMIHSLGFAVIFSVLVVVVCYITKADRPLLWGGVGLMGYSSHLFLDYLVKDPAPPYGAQFLWPFSKDYYMASFAFFPGFHYLNPDGTILSAVFSLQNVKVFGFELLVFLPIIFFFIFKGMLGKRP